MKILYVEDEIVKHLGKIEKLFGKYLSEEVIQELGELKADINDGIAIDPKEIKQTIEKSGIVEIEYHFPDALKKVVLGYEKYDLFVIDRNLASVGYKKEEIPPITSPKFDVEKYKEREGDYFLNYLFCREGVKILKKFYFLSAYEATDIRNRENLEYFFDIGEFSKEKFIEKGNEKDEKRLRELIDNLETVKLRYDNQRYIQALLLNINSEISETFFQIVMRQYLADDITSNVINIRSIYENIIQKIAEKKNITEVYDTQGNQKKFNGDKFVKYLYDNTTRKTRLKAGPVISIFAKGLFPLASALEAHKNFKREDYQPSLETVQALVSMLKDIILWFEDVVNS
ncbi:MAG: hypothetical protein H7A23_05510 [Leptospiraceae bacterium]|nr:hypothetical protein [Leptospiraceae bacterium]